MNRRLGCLTGGGLLAAALTLALVLVFYLARGGGMFSPGRLNAQPGEQVLGTVISHGATGGNCAACHTAPWSAATMADRCLACHTTVAEQLRTNQGLHAKLRGSTGASDCRECHREHRGETAALTEISAETFPHDSTGYSLAGHKTTSAGKPFACSDCHTATTSDFSTADCTGCHQQIDAAYMTAHVADFGDACLNCHDGVDRYSRKTFDHNALAFPLQGKHAQVACSKCHLQATKAADLNIAQAGCVDCHRKDDKHQGKFGADCAACHNATTWSDAKIDHSKTAFPLTGKHVDVKCDGCHQNGVFKGTPQKCVDCHQKDDKHQGKFGTDCAQCHTTASWDAQFDHSQTAFPLTGKHSDVRCEACHHNGTFKGTPQKCVDCHQKDDKHNGQFGTDCAACHNTTSWPDAQFDHAKTAFPLTGKHAGVKCEACHKNGQYKGTSTQCAACHADPDFHRGAFGTQCADCHTANGWEPATFNGQHTFPINHGEEHAAATCRTCHPQTVKAYTCYGCHEHNQAETIAKHREEVAGDISNCVKCHPTGQEGEHEGGGRGGDD